MSHDFVDVTRTPEPGPRPTPPSVADTDRGPALPDAWLPDTLVALVRDPHLLHAYWHLRDLAWTAPGGVTPLLRVFDLDAATSHDVPVLMGARKAYLDVRDNARFRVELGYRTSDHGFTAVLRSNVVQTPPTGPSGQVSADWTVSPEQFQRLLHPLDGGGPPRYDKAYPTS